MLRSNKGLAAQHDWEQVESIQRKYIPLVASVLHFLCRVETKPSLIFSLKDLSNCWFQREANFGLLHSFLEGLTPRMRCITNCINSIVDIVPFVSYLLTAGYGEYSLSRPVSTIDLMKPKEKIKFEDHVRILVSLGLSYVRDDSIQSNLSNSKLILQPAIDSLVAFSDLVVPNKNEIPSVLKELLAHSAKLESMKNIDKKANIMQNNSAETSTIIQRKETVNQKRAQVSISDPIQLLKKTKASRDNLSPTSAKRQKVSVIFICKS